MTTCEMKIYIESLYEKLRFFAEKEQIFQPIRFYFAETTPKNSPGDFCYSDEKYYYYGSIGDRGEVTIKKTSNLFDVAYWIFKFQTSIMAFDYAKRQNIELELLRSVAFPKQLELMGLIEGKYRQKLEIEINEIAKTHPF